ncbi:hypothetical protein ACOMHN_009977 [Nucella lapillus]
MFSFFKKHPPKEGEEREKLKKELFEFQKCADHGFPSKPSAMAYDPKLKLLAIGTKSGVVKVFGAPGVEFSGVHKEDVSVTSLFFLPEEARLVSVCSDNTLHLWEVNLRNGNSILEEVKQFSMENNKMKTISTCCLTGDGENLLLGTEGGNIHVLHTPSFTLADNIIYQDMVMQNVPDDFKVNPGAVEAIAVHPTNSDKFLIGYNRGLIVLWDNKESKTEQTYSGSQQLESVTWSRSGEQFYSSHSDGCYTTWDVKESSEPKDSVTPYGPFPCKGINKLLLKASKGGRYVMFSGGMPRASYGDRHTVTVMQGDDLHVVFDFTSRIVDFMVLSRADESDSSDNRAEKDEPHALVILAEEEVVVVDLESMNWPAFRLPYLQSVHCSAITCAQHVLDVPEQLWQKVLDAGDAQSKSYSAREWPITGGKNLAKQSTSKDLLITGHEDGTVRFWDASGSSLSLMYRMATSPIFGIVDHAVETPSGDDEWPPFRKVGTFDPYSDDPRLAIQKMMLCPLSETLVVGGTAGQVVVLQMERETRTQELQAFSLNLMGDKDNFVWKGHEALSPAGGDMHFAAGFQPTCIMQLHPPAACTALSFHSEWQLVAAGTNHGFGLFDYAQKKPVAYRCTLNVEDLSGSREPAVSRRRSFRKSLRESFRRLRKGSTPRERSESSKDKTETQHIEQTAAEGETSAPAAEAAPQPAALEATPTDPAPASDPTPAPEATPEAEATPAAEATTPPPAEAEATPAVEATPTASETPATPTPEAATPTPEASTTPAVEPAPASEPAPAAETTPAPASTKPAAATEPARPVERVTDDTTGSMVRCLYFADTFIINGGSNTPSLWVGTNAGHVYVYSLTVPASDKRSAEQVGCVLAKEVKLRHQAPVISIAVIDTKNRVLPESLEVINERAKAPDMEGQHSVIICSEEQLKAFTLPTMKPRWKNKITAVDGARLRRVAFVSFRSTSGDNYSEYDIVSLNNNGELGVYSVYSLRRQMLSSALRKEDINGISSLVFTKNGQGYFLQSPSEFSQVSLSTSGGGSRPVCMVELKEGLRPEPPEPVVEVTPPSPTQEEPPPTVVEQIQEMAAGVVSAVAGSYDTGDITSGLNDSQVNDSQIDTSANITIDSVREHVTEAAMSAINETTTMVTTDTTVVTVTAPSPLPPDVSVENEEMEPESPQTNGPATNGTDEPSSPVDEIVDKFQEAVVAAVSGEDPAAIKQKLMDETVTVATSALQNAF